MNNYKLSKGCESYDRRSYQLYLRSESARKLLDTSSIKDLSFTSYENSKFMGYRRIRYSEYISEALEKSISYSEYLADKLDKSISYSEYLSGII